MLNILKQQYGYLISRPKFAKSKISNVMNTGQSVLTIFRYPLVPGWNKKEVNIYIVIPCGYPVACPRHFFTDPLTLANGSMPSCTSWWGGCYTCDYCIEGIPTGSQWWSLNISNWNPNRDILRGYVGAIERRLKITI